MPFTIDLLDDGRVLEWEATADGAVATERDETELVRAVESVLAPLGWNRSKIRCELTRIRVPELAAFADTNQN